MRIEVVGAGEFGERAAEVFLELVGDTPRVAVGLATGNTPTPMYGALARRGVPPMRAFAIDEYVGPAEHRCANRAYFERHWLPIPGASAVEQFDVGARDLEDECRRFAEAIEAAGGLDLVVLGIGKNGHLAFNEPGSTLLTGARVVELAASTRAAARGCWGEDVPGRGVTLGLREIIGARKALLLASGRAKAGVVARALGGEIGSRCPASYLQEHDDVTVVLDGEAAQGLR